MYFNVQLMELHASSLNCMQDNGTACKLMELHIQAHGTLFEMHKTMEPWLTLVKLL